MDAALADKFNLIASYVALAIECGAVFVVAFGALQAMAALLKAIANGQATGLEGRQIWLRFATWILLGLEFALAADILRTAVAPTWDDIIKARRHRHHPHHAQLLFGQGHHGLRQEPGSWLGRGRSLGKTGPNPEIKALLISWTLRRICGSVP